MPIRNLWKSSLTKEVLKVKNCTPVIEELKFFSKEKTDDTKYAKFKGEIEAWLILLKNLNHFPKLPSCFPLEFTTWQRYAGQKDVEVWFNHMCGVNYTLVSPSLVRKEIDELKKKKVDVSEYESLFPIYERIYFARLEKQIENEFARHWNYPDGFDSSAPSDIRRYLEQAKKQGMDADYIKSVEGRLPALDISCAMIKAKNAADQWPRASRSTGKDITAKDVYCLIAEACCFYRLNKKEKAEMDSLAVSFTKKWMDRLVDAKGGMDVEKICNLIEIAVCHCLDKQKKAEMDSLIISFTEKMLKRLTDAQMESPGCYSVEETKMFMRRANLLWVDISTIEALLPQIDAACKLDEKTYPVYMRLSYIRKEVQGHETAQRGKREMLQYDADCLQKAMAEIKKIKKEGFEVSDLEKQAGDIRAEIENAGEGIKL